MNAKATAVMSGKADRQNGRAFGRGGCGDLGAGRASVPASHLSRPGLGLGRQPIKREESMFKRLFTGGGLAAILTAIPSLALAAGEKAADLIVVADTRALHGTMGDIHRYFGNLYNEDMLIFAVWSVVITTALGMVLGILMDGVMKMTGIDRPRRSISVH
jgi:hypothetical protein